MLFALAPLLRAAEAPAATFAGATPVEWSTRLARSEMARLGESRFYGAPKARWDYTSALFGQSLVRLGEKLRDPAMVDYGFKNAGSFLAPDGSIRTYDAADYNLDLIPAGKLLLWRYAQTHDEKLVKPIETLRHQLATQPRTSDGGFWHKQRYPHQMWLDGIFMASPFLAQYGQLFHDPTAFDEVANQIILMDRHAYDAKTGLYYHAWDEARAQSWANKETGQSPSFWGRAEGWYAMAIVDSLDYLPPTHPDVEKLNEILRRVADGLVRWQDPATGLWWQVLDQGGRQGNYREATASSMAVYALAKGVNRGYLSREKYRPAILRGYEGIVRDLLRTDAAGAVSLTHCCAVAGLGYTSASGRPRDGSFDYYISEPVVDNDLKGVGPFILAGLEVGHLLATPADAAPFMARSWADYDTVLARIHAPTFPDHDFPITDFGAKPGTDASGAIRAAIAACHAAGGGRVVVPAGEWLTGAIRLLSNVNLHVAEGATLRWLFDTAKYPIVLTRWEGVECMNYSAFIYAFEQENIAVTGGGTLDGGANWDTWWAWNKKSDRVKKQEAARNRLNEMGQAGVPVEKRVFGDGDFLRPNFFQPYRCKNILIEGVSIVGSPMWEINPELSSNITVHGVKINSHGPNNDGCDPESCRDVLIEDCVFDTGDDCIAIKSGRNHDGRRVNVPSENLVVRRCTMLDGHGGVVLGSEITGGVRNVFVENCTMDSPNLDRAFRFKDNAVRGGVLENFFARHVKIGRVGEAVLTIDLLYEEGAKGPFQPIVRHIQLDHITSSGSPRVMYLRGFPGAIIDDIRISDSTFNSVTETEVVQHAGAISFDRVTINPAKLARSLNSRPTPPTAP